MTILAADKRECIVSLKRPHTKQLEFINSKATRRIIRAGRRSGKTVGIAILAIQEFLAGKRVLYIAPTADQTDAFWYEVNKALANAVYIGAFKRNETERYIELGGSKNRIRAKTGWSPDQLRGDYADWLLFDEWQLCNEDMWELVGQPMLLDTGGSAMFIYTPPSLHSRSVSKARDPRHAAKMFQKALQDKTGRWQTFHFSSHDNPFISKIALEEITQDMTRLAYRQEILAEDIDEAPGALWSRKLIADNRAILIRER